MWKCDLRRCKRDSFHLTFLTLDEYFEFMNIKKLLCIQMISSYNRNVCRGLSVELCVISFVSVSERVKTLVIC